MTRDARQPGVWKSRKCDVPLSLFKVQRFTFNERLSPCFVVRMGQKGSDRTRNRDDARSSTYELRVSPKQNQNTTRNQGNSNGTRTQRKRGRSRKVDPCRFKSQVLPPRARSKMTRISVDKGRVSATRGCLRPRPVQPD